LQSLNKNDVCMNRIKEELEAKGISQTELANRLGKTFNMVNLYATNKVQPPIPVLYQIAKILNVDVRTLLTPTEVTK
jgi:putative transcriptional regulator